MSVPNVLLVGRNPHFQYHNASLFNQYIGAVNKPSGVSFSGDCENDDEITLHWSAPTKYVGPASHYIIRYAHGSKFNKKEKYELDTDTPVTGTSYTIKTELLPHIPLRFCVQAVSTSGNVVVKSECSSFTDICVIPPVGKFLTLAT